MSPSRAWSSRAPARARARGDRCLRRLAGDLPHILNRSLWAPYAFDDIRSRSIPWLTILSSKKIASLGRDDYELLFTVSRERAGVESLRELAIALTRIGSIRTGEPKLVVMDTEHKPMSFRGGFDHFAGR